MKKNIIDEIESHNWDLIDWYKITQIVFLTQKKIWHASTNNQIKLVRKIQTQAFNSWSFKLLAINYVTSKKFLENIGGIKYKTYVPNQYKIELAKKLIIENKAINLTRTDINQKTLPLIIKDSALQLLIKLILEPEWIAKTEDSVYSYKSNLNVSELIYDLCSSVKDKNHFRYIIHGYISKVDKDINLNYFDKAHSYSGIISKQLNTWVTTDCFTSNQLFTKLFPKPEKNIISYFMIDILLHGLEWNLYSAYSLEYKSSLISRKIEDKFPFKLLRIADQIVILVDNVKNLFDIIYITNSFLKDAGLGITNDSIEISHIEKGFDFLGFYIKKYRGYNRVSVLPTKAKMQNHLTQLKNVLYHEHEGTIRATTNKSLDEVINEMNPMIHNWCLYYKDFVDQDILRSLDWKISNSIYKWFKKKVKSVNTLSKWKRNCQIILNGKQRIGTGFNSVLILHSDFKANNSDLLKYKACIYYDYYNKNQ
uniref:Maturase n=1 Tax=Porphyridium sordidum TaxID=28024 RepID=A0A1C9CDP3_PORSO|nr:maturase [Porphyridium sordidum]AOM66477.1 maturase [Porphyridium sordidum]